MRACVFVDGENFRHSMLHLFAKSSQHIFKKEDYLPKNASWGELFDDMIVKSANGASRLRTYWYVIDEVDFIFTPPSPRIVQSGPEKLTAWIKEHRSRINGVEFLRNMKDEDIADTLRGRQRNIAARFDGFRKIQRGIMRKHNAIEFKYSGALTYDLINQQYGKEKTVDVNLAVNMLALRDNYDIAVIVSGDQDYLPAVQAVKNAGKTVVNVAFKDQAGILLPGGAKRLKEATDQLLEMDYDTVARHIFPPSSAAA